MSAPAEVLLDRVSSVVRDHLPAGVTPSYFDAFMARQRPVLVSILSRHLAGRTTSSPPAPFHDAQELPPEEWTASRRTRANLAAMELAASKPPKAMTPADRLVLAGYSGWGGLSIDKVRGKFPGGFPVPEARGLIHEYYTPTRVVLEVARVIKPLIPGLKDESGVVHALEPSAGIGRFLRATATPSFKCVRWTAVEWSELSSRMLRASMPHIDVFEGPFERWIREHGTDHEGRLRLILANPPYGARGAAVTEDPDRKYREKAAYAYFLRRGLDLLAPGGLGVYLVPSGFLTGRAVKNQRLRDKILRRHHLAAAYRLPSKLFPGAMLVTDLLFFRARGGELAEVLEDDGFITEGRYFEKYPEHILGTEIGKDAGSDDQTKKARFGYQVQGEFTQLPDLVERPLCTSCSLRSVAPTGSKKRRQSLTRHKGDAEGLPPELAAAASLGLRVDRFLATVAAGDSEEPVQLWGELHTAMLAWTEAHGSPHRHRPLLRLAKTGHTGAERFLAAFLKTGTLIPGLRKKPVYTPRYSGSPDDVVAQAELAWRRNRSLTIDGLLTFHRTQGGSLTREQLLPRLLRAGWFLDGDGWNDLVPASHYLSGHLWPKYDRAAARAINGDLQAAAQAKRLLEVIQPAVYEDVDGVSPRQGWLPLELVAGWMAESLNAGRDIELVRRSGLVQLTTSDYEEIKDDWTLRPEARWCVGWINHDKTVFRPRKRKDQNLDELRMEHAARWDASFRAWIAIDEERRARIEHAYNRGFRGFVAPTFSSEPLSVARWTDDGIKLHPHQAAGARRVLANRGGLIAFDVGVGKTYAALGILGRARQEGWVRRPVIVVPNSIVWKWEADVRRVLPDYRVAVIGSRMKVLTRGERRGQITSETDTPAERARKWTAFQAGQYDVVLLTYSALGRTRMNETALRRYADHTEAIRREVKLRQRNARGAKRLSERQKAVLKEGVAAWVAEKLELPAGWDYDPGIAWDELGIDLLIIDEAQNFKNLYMPEAREGGVPRFMGNAGEGSNRAWQLDFRCAAVRQHTGGSGIVLLSATPAKNSPLEFYNLVQFVDHEAWSRMGIRDPEQFIDRYLRIEIKPVVNTKMDVEERSAVVGFQNLHELRDVIFRYGEFKTAEDVGLKLPEPKVQVVEVDMDAAQDAKYDRYVAQIEAALESTNISDKAQILGLLARMALVAIHAELDEGHNWKTAESPDVDPHSPKLDALAVRVLANRGCGHIVFVDNIAAHVWTRRVLVEAGIPAARIAVLNAKTAKASADRQRIAGDFNGDPAAGVLPKYDVVIANAIAYEGIDLQTRTCAIHHLDLPWEPATLQQRNGRGVRQGNTLEVIEINYYFARRSQDGLRFNLIQGKLGWMTELLRSQARDTNNPGAQMEMGPEELLLLISRDPEKTRQRLNTIRAKRQAEAHAKAAQDAARLLRSINARFRKAERAADPMDAKRLRLEAEERLGDLARVDADAWPWLEHSMVVRERELLVPVGGAMPVHEGLKVGVPAKWNPERVEHAEFGRIVGTSVGVREAGSAGWTLVDMDRVESLGVEPEHLSLPWPDTDEDAIATDLESRIARLYGDWHDLGWQHASRTFVERWWPRVAHRVVEKLAGSGGWYARQQKVPVLVGAELRIGGGDTLRRGEVLPPTDAGWRRFVELGPSSGLKWSELAEAGEYWWSRKMPRDVLSAARGAA